MLPVLFWSRILMNKNDLKAKKKKRSSAGLSPPTDSQNNYTRRLPLILSPYTASCSDRFTGTSVKMIHFSQEERDKTAASEVHLFRKDTVCVFLFCSFQTLKVLTSSNSLELISEQKSLSVVSKAAASNCSILLMSAAAAQQLPTQPK